MPFPAKRPGDIGLDLGSHLPALLKSLADAYPKVSLVLAGSKKHLMEQLVATEDAPLYGMAEHFALDTLPEEVMTKFVLRRAKAGGKTMAPEAARHLVDLAGPVPNDIQHLAYEAFDAAGWLAAWLDEPVPALGGRRPGELLDTAEGRALVSRLLMQMQAGTYA